MKIRDIEICPGAALELQPDTIEPSWIIDGAPRTRSAWWAASSDGVAENFIWDCTAGRFRWYFGVDEVVHIIEGEVEVSGDGIETTWLRVGDAALFRAGTCSTWHVPTYVRKHAVLHSNLPAGLRVQLGFLRRMKGLARRLLRRQQPAQWRVPAAGAMATSSGPQNGP